MKMNSKTFFGRATFIKGMMFSIGNNLNYKKKSSSSDKSLFCQFSDTILVFSNSNFSISQTNFSFLLFIQ